MSIKNLIEIKPYEEDYERLMIDFEKSSALEIGEDFPESQVKTATAFHQKYSSKSKLYEWSEIIMVIERSTQNIIGTAQMLLKTAYFGDVLTKFIQVTAIKVHPEYQKQGIGHRIIKYIERKAKNLGVFRIYAKIDSNNKKAINFFRTKLKYTQCSISSVMIVPNHVVSPNASKILKEMAIKYTKEFYSTKDMALSNYNEIFDSPAYIGSYILHKNNEYIGGSIWNLSYYSEIELTQVIISAKYIKNDLYYRLFCVFFITVTLLYLYLWYYFYKYFEDNSFKILEFTLFLFFGFFTMKTALDILKYARQARTTYKPRVKLFGLFYSNSLENKKDMLNEFLSHVASCEKSEYTSFEYNEEDVYSKFLAEDYLKIYYQKNLDSNLTYKWNKRQFIDPRD
jgi:N-acetylglutamate synthase-like GNAT family acetyltransferase